MSQGTAECDQERQQLRLVQRIALLAAEHAGLSEFLHATLMDLARSYNVDGGGIFQIEEQKTGYPLIAHLGIEPATRYNLTKHPPGKGLAEEVVRKRSPVNWPELRGVEQVSCHKLLDSGWRSLLALPLLHTNQLVGVLFLLQRMPRQFSPREIDLLEPICRILAGELAIAKRLEQLSWQQQHAAAGQHDMERSRIQLRAHLLRLEESNRTLEQINRSQTRFLGITSHELRTPLTCILSAAELLRLKLPDEMSVAHELATTVEQGALRLQDLIDELMEMVRLESGDTYLAREPLDIERLLKDLHTEYSPRALAGEIHLDLNIQARDSLLLGDFHHLQRALGCLVDNAFKFTPASGRIRLLTRHHPGKDLYRKRLDLERFSPAFFTRPLAETYLELQIHDSGTGIDPEQRLLIFDPFQSTAQIGNHGTDINRGNGSGRGLGLTLARSIVERHNGMIWVDSPGDSGSGTVFHVVLPLQTQHQVPD